MNSKTPKTTKLDTGNLEEAALHFHKYPKPGKLEITATKPLGNQRDLALAYSPGVAAPCLAIEKDPLLAADYTIRANLVAVVTNGTAVLGLGDIGPLAAKPVMEGKAVLFKKFAGIDVFDIEIDAKTVDEMVSVIGALEPTFGGINLEDIKAPECFEVEQQLREKMDIPVFHDDQHGTAIIVAAAILNGLELSGKKLEDIKIVASGAGAASLACLNLLVELGAKRENILVNDREGTVYTGRNPSTMDRWKEVYAQDTDCRTLADCMPDADLFLGLSAAGVLTKEMVKGMAKQPMIMALANPDPEILPEDASEVRPDAMICTGRSDYPNQVNNVLCFPFLFRGALDVSASAINEEMKMAAVRAIAELAREESSDVVAQAYGGEAPIFGLDYLIPSPFDPRLILRIAPAVAQAAMDSGVARRPIEDMDAYLDRLNRFVYRSGIVMKPLFAAAKSGPETRVIFAEGEDERVMRAAQVLLEDGIAKPILIGRPQIITHRLEQYGLKIRPGTDFECINPEQDDRYRDYVETYAELACRAGVSTEAARTIVRTDNTVIACVALKRGDADAVICGLEGRYTKHLRHVNTIIGKADGVHDFSAMSLLITQKFATFFADTYVNEDHTAEELAEMSILCAREIERFGIKPSVALVSHSNFGSRDSASALKMREALALIKEADPELEVDGEMHADSALSRIHRENIMPNSELKAEANLLIFPNLDSANISLNVAKVMTNGLHIGPILLGAAAPVHILAPFVTTRGVVNVTALAVVEAQTAARQGS
ncbi:MAG: NADP-dependent malic enzyme [Rhizobiaceae bacterium]|nr:NADP-dependent malic enzyme [Rhizobiaceae bacterium]